LILSIIPLDKFIYNTYIIGVVKKDKNLYYIYNIVGVIEKDKHSLLQLFFFLKMVCCNLKVTKMYTYNFNQNYNFIKKNIVHNLRALAQ